MFLSTCFPYRRPCTCPARGTEASAMRRTCPERGIGHSHFRLEEQYLSALDPSFPQIHAEPTVAVPWLDAHWRSGTEFSEVILLPRLPEVRGVGNARFKGGGGGAVTGDHDAILDDHVRHLELCVEEQGMLFRMGEFRWIAAKDAAVVFLVFEFRAVRVGGPVELSIDEVDAARFEARIGVHGNECLPIPGVRFCIISAAQPVTFIPVTSVDVSGAGVEGIFGGVVGHGVDVTADEFIGRVSKEFFGGRVFLLELGIPTKRIGELDGFTAVGGVKNVHRHGTAEDVAVVSPHEHFFPRNIPGMHSVERVKIPTGLLGVFRCVRAVVGSVGSLDDNLAMTREIVCAEEKSLTGRKENVPIFQ